MRLIVAAAAALLVIGFAATAAQGSSGTPLVLGEQNDAGSQTTYLSAAVEDAAAEHGVQRST
jgi:anti-sigma-K factor RskA